MSTLDIIQHDTIIGPYCVVRELKGRGGMAHVYEAKVREKYRQPTSPRRVALKVAKMEYEASLKAEADFLKLFDQGWEVGLVLCHGDVGWGLIGAAPAPPDHDHPSSSRSKRWRAPSRSLGDVGH